jgi:hypothetical protein
MDLGDWVLSDETVAWQIEGDCVVVSVTDSGGVLETQLDCMDGEMGPHRVTVEVASAPGTPTWGEGDALTLAASIATNGGGIVGGDDPVFDHFPYLSTTSLRRVSDGALVLGAIDGSASPAGVLAPFDVEVNKSVCGEVNGCAADPDLPDELPLQFSVGESGGEELLVTGGQAAELTLADGTTLYIDAPYAHAISSCHENTYYDLVARRMQ